MKIFKKYLLLLFILSNSLSYSQENIKTSIIEPFQKDALFREKVFIQLNKSIYFSNENCWFTAFVADDKNNMPSESTSNLHVNLLNQKGDIIDSKTIFISDGIGNGDFFINNTFKSGKYYIQGFTNYMKNFGNDNVFIQEIEIINPGEKRKLKENKIENKYDLQVFPESGYLLEGAFNTVGIKALINGKGYPFTGKIINSEGKEISNFKGNPTYYFRNSYFKQQEALDLLLLNQGWTTYSLEEKINEINPKKQFEFESGFTINGTIKKIPRGYDIGILTKENRLATFSNFNSKQQFSFKNVFAYKNDSVKIALIKKDQPIINPGSLEFTQENKKIKNYKYLTSRFIQPKIKSDKNLISTTENGNIPRFKRYPNVEELDLVMLKKVVSKKKKTFYDKENELAHNHKVLAPSFYQNKKVTEQLETTFQNVFEYFMSLGFIKRKALGGFFISLRNAPVTFFGSAKNPDNTYPPKIYLDNTSLDRNGDIEKLKELSMKDIDEILINKSGAGGGIDGTGGIIKIYRKKGNHQYFEEEGKDLYENLVLLTGFDRATAYYKPLYNIYSKESFNWTEINWIHTLQTNDKGEGHIKIPTNEFSNEFQFIINGFSNNGLLFNTIFKTSKISF